MRRRAFLAAAGAAAIWPGTAGAQQPGKIFRLGVVGTSPDHQALLDELGRRGFRAGENLLVEHRAADDPRQLAGAAADLARMAPDAFVIAAPDPDAALKVLAAQAPGVPTVLTAFGYDPVQRGYAARLARPGGNITGVSLRQSEFAVKQLELLTQAAPDGLRVGILWDTISADQFVVAFRVARSVHLRVHGLQLEHPPYDVDAAFRQLVAEGAQSVLMLSSPFFAGQLASIVDDARHHRLPAMFPSKGYALAGGLLSYGVDEAAANRRVAALVAKILDGARPAELPMEQVRDFELYINMKTAKAMGLLLPEALLMRADELIG